MFLNCSYSENLFGAKSLMYLSEVLGPPRCLKGWNDE